MIWCMNFCLTLSCARRFFSSGNVCMIFSSPCNMLFVGSLNVSDICFASGHVRGVCLVQICLHDIFFLKSPDPDPLKVVWPTPNKSWCCKSMICTRLSLRTSPVAHQVGAYPGFCSMKRLGVFLFPPGWDASPSQGYPQH